MRGDPQIEMVKAFTLIKLDARVPSEFYDRLR